MKKFVSWNVNGIRAAQKKGLESSLTKIDPDWICLQETKAEPEQVSLNLEDYPHKFWNSALKKGYSGTAIFTKNKPLECSYGLGEDSLDQEGRVITLEYDKFYLVNVYTPNSKRELLRLDYRINQWDFHFRKYIKKLNQNKTVIVCGDFNVAHTEIDLANPKTNTKNPGFTPDERDSFTKLLDNGLIDTFREKEKGPNHYSWWTYKSSARERNIGWRIDYFLMSKKTKEAIVDAKIHPEIHGSDHCPVSLTVDLNKIQ